MLHTPGKRRRIINGSILLLAIVAASFALQIVEISLLSPPEWSGWTILISSVVLLFYGVRKRMSSLPLGRVALWLQLHIYLAVFCAWVFALHINWRIPNGWFEIALSVSFIGTVLTGLLGLYWSRTLPPQLTRLGDEVIYERIPGFVSSLRSSAESEVLKAVEVSGSGALAEFYEQSGHQFFSKPRFQWAILIKNLIPSFKIQQSLGMSRRYMTGQELPYADRLSELIEQKSRLDAHYTLQGTLKRWLTVHLAFSLSLIPLVTLHVLLAYNFALV